MGQNISAIILDALKKHKKVTASEIVNKTGFSRAYVNRFFQSLKDEGKIVLIGKANKAHYLPADERAIKASRHDLLSLTKVIRNKDISEDVVLDDIKKDTGIFEDVARNVSSITGYAFSEMLNNAIEHSRSKLIKITVKRDEDHITFSVEDKGVGIFNNIRKKKGLSNNLEAIQDLLKGKQTTAPEAHSGEGIFFTSKVADILTIQSSEKKLVFNNLLADIFIKDIRRITGTKVNFCVSVDTKKQLEDIFRKYTDSSFEFSKTDVIVKLYKMGHEYISRSQARRIVAGLEKFKNITLDFNGVDTVGQAFADEIFRVWESAYPHIKIISKHANENVEFIIKRAVSSADKYD